MHVTYLGQPTCVTVVRMRLYSNTAGAPASCLCPPPHERPGRVTGTQRSVSAPGQSPAKACPGCVTQSMSWWVINTSMPQCRCMFICRLCWALIPSNLCVPAKLFSLCPCLIRDQLVALLLIPVISFKQGSLCAGLHPFPNPFQPN
jgi:hypothetical protein